MSKEEITTQEEEKPNRWYSILVGIFIGIAIIAIYAIFFNS
ncbi:hypothetical protein [Tengunoibacter tsumagoiensis]|uniref:Uncharacterized protein n=1 Tax=Tengunoibacter tsumagoiensis TaxID=2014871 RepID=A0A402A2W9_9CHLR|nr:hypothetical protein [Tengunoibacter tsumagoiensis]GCE13395.1 hypothetical protein KTT_32540 [Tengunoibacter tsumagoiensis]